MASVQASRGRTPEQPIYGASQFEPDEDSNRIEEEEASCRNGRKWSIIARSYRRF